MSEKYDTSMLPQVEALRVCLSCWRRVPSVLSRHIHHQRFPNSSPLTCSGQCGYRWASLLQNSERHMSSSQGEKPDISSNPFFDKYKKKLKTLQKEEPEVFESRLDDLRKGPALDMAPPPEEVQTKTRDTTQAGTPEFTGPRSWPPKSLDEIMKVDMIKDLPVETIKTIWQEHHLKKDCIFSVVPKEEYDEIITKSKLNPAFLFPLPRGDGYEFFLCQFNGKNVFFTSLAMFQLIKENAPACLSVAHFPELKEEKGIALMAGEYDDKIIKKSEALNLVKQMSMFYGKSAGERYLLLRTFHANPGAFDHMQLIEEYKRNKDYLENNLY
ncbi:ATP synthase mitochondrial F1 complex assembly factor 1-like isoform X2 [Mya arenaria]|nr:ATP synthase mitochondrial F1 complex assembly factor 1-like isoform X2 [Mya arenaria]XP_052776814.1 ATP synthase mitochondrial F1 complex assembly factor 1-like isoform X2 [Mya arenaria]XP_052776816.1 ATP synthase mitochondrial F1 complex assembly factor 1-like isoform X2 [Mya arenaria]